MPLDRRNFIRLSAGSAALLHNIPAGDKRSNTLDYLRPMLGGISPVTLEERQTRIQKAQRLMEENKIAAIVLDCGTSMQYFTGISWWPSERTMVAIIPAKGEVSYVSPAFEAERLHQLITIGKEVRVWEEHESPYKVAADILKDYNIRSGNIGMEERLRFFIFDGIRKEAPQLNYVSADPVTMNCRLIKSPAEIALMKKASDITIAAYKASVALLHEGMTPADFSATAEDAHARLGVKGELSANFGAASAYPHGSARSGISKRKHRQPASPRHTSASRAKR